MKEIVYFLSRRQVHGLRSRKLAHGRVPDRLQGAEAAHQSLPSCFPDALDVIQHGMYLGLCAQGSVVFNGKPVSLVLDPGDQMKSLGMRVDGDLFILKLKSSRPVVIVLDHTAHGDVKMKLLQDL